MSSDPGARLRELIAQMRTYEGCFGERTRLTILRWADELDVFLRASASALSPEHVATPDSTGVFCVCGARMADVTAHAALSPSSAPSVIREPEREK